MSEQRTAFGGGVIVDCLRHPTVNQLAWALAGFGVLALIWHTFGWYMGLSPRTQTFTTFGLIPTLEAFPVLWHDGRLPDAVRVSTHRLAEGMFYAIIIGVPVGILVGLHKRFRDLSNSPFQLLRMVSPLAWSPIVVYVFATWHGAIVFLIAVAAVWPIIYSTSAGLAKVDPAWFKVSRNLGAKPWHVLTKVIIPAITFDILSGIRLAVSVAWIVLVPAEYLGVTSGLGYAVQDTRETLRYDQLMAMVVTIGAIGYTIDTTLAWMIKKTSWHRGDT